MFLPDPDGLPRIAARLPGDHAPLWATAHGWVGILLHHSHRQPFLLTTDLLAGSSLPVPWTEPNPLEDLSSHLSTYPPPLPPSHRHTIHISDLISILFVDPCSWASQHWSCNTAADINPGASFLRQGSFIWLSSNFHLLSLTSLMPHFSFAFWTTSMSTFTTNLLMKLPRQSSSQTF